MWGKLAVWIVGVVAVYAAFQFSPWPSALLIRHAFGKGGAEIVAACCSIAGFTIRAC